MVAEIYAATPPPSSVLRRAASWRVLGTTPRPDRGVSGGAAKVGADAFDAARDLPPLGPRVGREADAALHRGSPTGIASSASSLGGGGQRQSPRR